MLRSRMNNHRTNTKCYKPLHPYNHFNTDSHSFDDALIMPIEQILEIPTSVTHNKNEVKSKNGSTAIMTSTSSITRKNHVVRLTMHIR